MELIKLAHENLEKEHICCAISNNNDIQVRSKKSWLADRLDEGLVFLKCNVRGKCFIEYIPAEYAWAPVDAAGYLYIDCLWVSGQFKGQGYSNLLLDECIKDAKQAGKNGLVALSSVKKMGFLSDPEYLKYKGFQTADTFDPSFCLMYLPFSPDATKPQFIHNTPPTYAGFTLYYTKQCPFTAKYVPLLAETAKAKGADLHVVELCSREQARSAPTPFTTFSLFYNGKFLTHEIQSPKKFEAIIDSIGV